MPSTAEIISQQLKAQGINPNAAGYQNPLYNPQYGTDTMNKRYDITSPEVTLEMQKYPDINPDVAIGNVLMNQRNKTMLPAFTGTPKTQTYVDENLYPGDSIAFSSTLNAFDPSIQNMLQNGQAIYNPAGTGVDVLEPPTAIDPYQQMQEYYSKMEQDLMGTRREQLLSDLENQLAGINTQFDKLKEQVQLGGEQNLAKNKASLARMGILGASTAAPAFLSGIEQQNLQSIQDVDAKRAAALQAAKTAYETGDWQMVSEFMKQAQDLAKEKITGQQTQFSQRLEAEQKGINKFTALSNYQLGLMNNALKQSGQALDEAKLQQASEQFSAQMELDWSKFQQDAALKGAEYAIKEAEMKGYYIDEQGNMQPTAKMLLAQLQASKKSGGGGSGGGGGTLSTGASLDSVAKQYGELYSMDAGTAIDYLGQFSNKDRQAIVSRAEELSNQTSITTTTENQSTASNKSWLQLLNENQDNPFAPITATYKWLMQ